MDPVTLGAFIAVPLLWFALSGGSAGDESDGDQHHGDGRGGDIEDVDTDLDSIRDLQRD